MTDNNTQGIPPQPGPPPPHGPGPQQPVPPGPPAAVPPGQPSAPVSQQGPKGQIRHQDPATTQPRPPTLAEQRAREQAQRASRERWEAQQAEAVRKAKLRKRLLIGGGVGVGVVAIVAIWYLTSQPDDVTARCVDTQGNVVDDDYCDDDYARSHGGYPSNGFIFIGGTSYRYHYGGTASSGKISGGTSVRPSKANVSTPSGKSIQRGGFGIKGSSGKSGGS